MDPAIRFPGASFQYDVPAIIQHSSEANNAGVERGVLHSSKEHSMSNSNGVYPLRGE